MALIGGAIAGIGALGSGILGSGASKKAASQQSQAAQFAALIQEQMFQATEHRLQPFVNTGVQANRALGGLLGLPGADAVGVGGFGPGSLVQPFQPTMAQLEQTPGFQFTKQQGIQATTNAAAAMGLGQSGSLLKGIDSFTTGLASNTFQQQFQNYWSQLMNVFNMTAGVSGQGLGAATQTGLAGGQSAAAAGNLLSAAGTAQAAGTVGSAAALSQPFNALTQIGLLSSLGNVGGQNTGSGGGQNGLLAQLGGLLGSSNVVTGQAATADQIARGFGSSP